MATVYLQATSISLLNSKKVLIISEMNLEISIILTKKQLLYSLLQEMNDLKLNSQLKMQDVV
jgi:hypothetical protein